MTTDMPPRPLAYTAICAFDEAEARQVQRVLDLDDSEAGYVRNLIAAQAIHVLGLNVIETPSFAQRPDAVEIRQALRVAEELGTTTIVATVVDLETDPGRAMVAFFAARLDERQAAAEKTSDTEYAWNVDRSITDGSVKHADLYPPSWALRDIAAGRELIRQYEEAREYYEKRTSAPAGELHGLYAALALRVSVYRGQHPAYDSSWKP
ncbi:DUF6221 family protein [Streptosporangium sp. NPDC002524]|uniref:DUF6221 family protein n=1 Tax=Streptosporangium sp. NPDC002524 TaxID=3154537 RepID=UPI0033286CCF